MPLGTDGLINIAVIGKHTSNPHHNLIFTEISDRWLVCSGGGPTGLSAAWMLQTAGVAFSLYEAGAFLRFFYALLLRF